MTNPIASSNVPKVIGIGCLIVLGLAMVAALLVWLNWGSIQETELYRSMNEMAGEMDQMLELRASLQDDYPAEEIQVRMGQQSGSQGMTHALTVALVNPDPALLEASGGEERLAREIALAVAKRYPQVERFRLVRISFLRRKKIGITFKETNSYPFPTADLLAELGAAAGDAEAADRNPSTLPSP